MKRRTFLKASWGAIGLTILAPSDVLAAPETLRTAPEGNVPGTLRRRIDGEKKVRGERIFARDFRVSDLKGWGSTEYAAMVVTAPHADRKYLGYDLAVLPTDLQPIQVVDWTKANADQIELPSVDGPPSKLPPEVTTSLFTEQDQYPLYVGQPALILIFEKAKTLRRARRHLDFKAGLLKWGPQQPVKPYGEYSDSYGSPQQLVFYAPDGTVDFSKTQDAPINGTDRAWKKYQAKQDAYRKKIRAEVRDAPAKGWKVYTGEASTQVLDPAFLEPESGLAHFDAKSGTLKILAGTQSPIHDASNIVYLFECARKQRVVKEVELVSCYPGGGFGGRDNSLFPLLLSIAAAFCDAPVRLALTRYDQFALGLKQLASDINLTIAVDEKSGRIQAIDNVTAMPAGGRQNYSKYVASLAGYCGAGAYVTPRAIVKAQAVPTRGVVAGSMRGFGGPQAYYAVESLVDEIAIDRGEDPIAFRERNALTRTERTVTGAPFSQEIPLDEICRIAREHPLWRERGKSSPDGRYLYGVGFGLANQAYGTGSDGTMAAIRLEPDGRLVVTTNAVDMGNGSASTLAVQVGPALGRNADAIEMGAGQVFIDHLAVAPQDSDTRKCKTRKAAPQLEMNHPMMLMSKMGALEPEPVFTKTVRKDSWANPRWTKSFSMSSSACITAFQQVHAAVQCSRVFLEAAVYPAAATLWKTTIDEVFNARWKAGELTLAGKPGLGWDALSEEIHRSKGVNKVVVHACFSGRWVEADFAIGKALGVPGRLDHSWPLDALTILRPGKDSPGDGQILRRNTKPPLPQSANYGRSVYSPSGSIAKVRVDTKNGGVQVMALHTILDAGRIMSRELVEGQYEGGAAMGIGYALFEDIPLAEDGGGNGRWNFDRYRAAHLADMPPPEYLTLQTIEDPAETTARGIGEAVLCPVTPAIANAVRDAIGRRIWALPITPAKVLEALQEAK